MRNAYIILVGKSEWKKEPHWRPRRTREYNIKMDLKETWHEGVDWIYVNQDRSRW
jgi:hypothetical protein